MKTIAAITEIVFIEDLSVPNRLWLVRKRKRKCLIWNPNETNPQEIAAVAFDNSGLQEIRRIPGVDRKENRV